MNAGFSSLAALKAYLLNESLRADTAHDSAILAIGLGMAGKIEGHCNRRLGRVEGDIYVTTGGRSSLIVPRYPVEEVTSVAVRDSLAADWTSVLDQLDAYSAESGTLYFTAPLDTRQIRVTYTGGYWWSTAEGDAEPAAVGQDGRAGQAEIESGARVVEVVFGAPLAQAPTAVSAIVLKPTTGGANVSATVRADTISTTGFTADLSGPVPASGYLLSYSATAPVLAAVESVVAPEGAALLPEAIRGAWLLQCEHVWRRRDKLGISIGSTESDKPAPGLADLQLIPLVVDMLRDHVRYNLT